MLGVERRQQIMQKLTRERKVYVSELAKLFQVTEETIRRDLEKLEAQDLLRRSYGGAILAEHTNEEVPYIRRTNINNESKNIIASKAQSLIHDGDTIMVDSSTTCELLLQRLKDQHRRLTVITNSVQLMAAYAGSSSSFTMICTGGTIRPNSYALTGAMTTDCLHRYYVDYALISCKGLDLEKGLMESNDSESRIKQLMMQQAKQSILLADHTKFGRTAFVRCGAISDLSCIVTDLMPSQDWQTYLDEHNIKLIV